MLGSQYAFRLSLIAFATAALRGLMAGSDFEGTMQSALMILAAFFALGWIIGELARRVLEEQVEAAMPQLLQSLVGADATIGDTD